MKLKAKCPECEQKNWNKDWDEATREVYGDEIGSISDPEYRDCAAHICPSCKTEIEGVLD